MINGQDFAPRQVVLIFSGYNLIAIDDVQNNGDISVKVPLPSSSNTNTASANSTEASNNIQLRFVESGTLRSGTFSFDGKTLKPTGNGEIAGAEGNQHQSGTATTTSNSSGNGASSDNNNNTTSSSGMNSNYSNMNKQ